MYVPNKYFEPNFRRLLNCKYTYTTAKHLAMETINISRLSVLC